MYFKDIFCLVNTFVYLRLSLDILILIHAATGKCGSGVYHLLNINDRLFGGFSSTLSSSSIQNCGEFCSSKADCKSIGFNIINRTCYLYTTRVRIGDAFNEQTDMVYYWSLEESCPSDYVYDATSNLCHRIVKNAKKYSEADLECRRDNGHLLILDSPEKRSYMLNKYNMEVSNFMIGGLQMANEGDWLWQNGIYITSGWTSDQPDDGGGFDIENCLQILFDWTNSSSNMFNDIQCENYSLNFICELPVRKTN